MKRFLFSFLAFLLCTVTSADEKRLRPRILGISRVEFYSTNISAARSFYSKVLHPEGECLWCEQSPRSPLSIMLSLNQMLTLSTAQGALLSNLLSEVDFAVEDLKALKSYLVANKIAFSEDKKDYFISLNDPEGHRVGFLEQQAHATQGIPGIKAVRLIHVGFVVRDREAEDHFYKDILGFHVYWHGGMKDGKDDWVDMQVPDGTDWIEYMLNVPADASEKTLGVMNHIALGVPDIHAAEAQLRKNGCTGTEQPQIGRDGKWQLNLYDPDDTRIEFMEFTPVQKPCCSEFAGPHPGLKQ
jgi:catechol 2,3-dioxygenase-like lactoylglutathione lyase family enzyme